MGGISMEDDYRVLERYAGEVRKKILSMIFHASGGHTGGSLSSADILVALYLRIMKIDPADPNKPDRDRFIMSKGHSVESLYATLATAGFIPDAELETYGAFNSRLYGHPTMKVPGVEIPSGSLGHGLSVGVGQAIAAKRSGRRDRVFVLMGDGEQTEGSLWEAAMSASHYGLDNLIGIIDYNKLQISGAVDTVMKTSSLRDRWASFGWTVHEIDGHDFSQLVPALAGIPVTPGTPHLIIAHTVKGKGVSFMENEAAWHHKVPSEEQYRVALEEVTGGKA